MNRSEQELQRRQQRADLEAAGINPYPYERDVTHSSNLVVEAFEKGEYGEEDVVSLAGRLVSKRVMGKASFFVIQDDVGTIQAYITRDEMPEGFYNDVFKKLIGLGDIVGISGRVFRTKTGEVSVRVADFELLSKSLRPMPVVKEKDGETFDEVTDKEFRYRQRYVDLNVNPETREVFRKRAKIISGLRSFLDERGYLEVETPVLQPLYGGAAARPFTTHHNALDLKLYMRIADELYLKRLIVGGFDGVYEISKDFRNEGFSRHHNPEFTMMELYVAYKDYNWMMDLVEEMVEFLATSLYGKPETEIGGNTISFARPWKRLPIFDAIEEQTGYNLFGKSQEELRQISKELGLEIDDSMGVGKIIDEVFGEFVEGTLIQPTFITDYPIELSPLAKKHREKEGLVERFEAICNGKEMCNAFSELNDADDQRARFEDQVRLGSDGDDEAMPIDEDYIRALEYGMPPTAGLGIGIDRLTMLLTGQEFIRDVILFPLMRPETED